MTTDEMIADFFINLFDKNREIMRQYEEGLVTGPDAVGAIHTRMALAGDVCALVESKDDTTEKIRSLISTRGQSCKS